MNVECLREKSKTDKTIPISGTNYVKLKIMVVKVYSHLTKTTRKWGRHGHDRMVVGFTTTYVISAYHH